MDIVVSPSYVKLGEVVHADTPQAPYPRIDQSQLKLSNIYQSSYAATTLHTCKFDDIFLSILTHQTIAMPRDLSLSRP
jgi:hypothetical protein